ncbi:MAG: cytochrome P450, partial [Nocardioidaceae bacterium]
MPASERGAIMEGMVGELPGPVGVDAVRWWVRMARDPLGTYGELARRYGTAVRLPYGRDRAFYLLSRPEHVEHVLVSRQDNYVKAFTYRPLRAFLRDGLLTSEGEVWRRHRRLVQPVFAHRHVAAFAPEMVAAATRRVKAWEAGDVVDVAAELHTVTLAVVGRALFGADLGSDAGRAGRALEVLQRGVLVGSFLPVRSDA